MAISGDQWLLLLFVNNIYDPEDPWKGLLKSSILVSVSHHPIASSILFTEILEPPKAYKHIFTSPSSVNNVAKATRSGNAHIHGMTCVTPASITYIATQVCASLHGI
jgi:hypothetical protein